MSNENQIIKFNQEDGELQGMSPDQLLRQVGLIQQIMGSVMKDGEHYGVIPGCGNKPTLLKAGAEKLLFTFRLRPELEVTQVDLKDEFGIDSHREYRVKCTLFSITTGRPVGQGVGSCSTMEGKYRFRTEQVGDVPQEYWKHRDPKLIGGADHFPKKIKLKDGNSKWVIIHRIPHDNPADHFNTVLKMASKRAMVAATLTATAASDLFTQDIEEIKDNLKIYSPEEEEEKTETPSAAALAPKAAPSSPPPPREATSSDSNWRDAVIHFGKQKGTKLGDLKSDTLRWWREEWQVREYPVGSGKYPADSMALRKALDQSMAEQPELEPVADDVPY